NSKMPTLLQQDRQRHVFEAVLKVAKPESTLSAVGQLMDAIHALPDRRLFRRELWGEMRRAINLHTPTTAGGLRRTAWNLRNRTRHQGRAVEERTLSRTLLVKGLQFDHGVVLDATEWDRKNFYVAVTRAKQSLAICAPSPFITPSEAL